ncbi:hypothetical protein B0H11DRAFT_358551 [Mycena galericulata]|nr:hypothetical protein B0H11DRAFT_358551 [Mycena galericulata]
MRFSSRLVPYYTGSPPLRISTYAENPAFAADNVLTLIGHEGTACRCLPAVSYIPVLACFWKAKMICRDFLNNPSTQLFHSVTPPAVVRLAPAEHVISREARSMPARWIQAKKSGKLYLNELVRAAIYSANTVARKECWCLYLTWRAKMHCSRRILEKLGPKRRDAAMLQMSEPQASDLNQKVRPRFLATLYISGSRAPSLFCAMVFRQDHRVDAYMHYGRLVWPLYFQPHIQTSTQYASK